MARNVLVVLVTCLVAMSIACNRNSQTVDASSGAPRLVDDAPDLVAQPNPPIADVPIPVGFWMDEPGSRAVSAGGARYIDHLYKGRQDKYAVRQFYRRQMVVHQWTLITDATVQGDIMLDFDKGAERCRIVIVGGNWFTPMQVKVLVTYTGKS